MVKGRENDSRYYQMKREILGYVEAKVEVNKQEKDETHLEKPFIDFHKNKESKHVQEDSNHSD